MLHALLFAMTIILQPPIILDNDSNDPSCWEGNCRFGIVDGEVYEVCQAYCNPAAINDGGWKKHAPRK